MGCLLVDVGCFGFPFDDGLLSRFLPEIYKFPIKVLAKNHEKMGLWFWGQGSAQFSRNLLTSEFPRLYVWGGSEADFVGFATAAIFVAFQL